MSTENTNASKPIFVMLVGPPGVGKTTWRNNKMRQHLPTGDIAVISSDDYIEEVAKRENKTYTEVFQSAIAYASDSSKKDFSEAVERGDHIVWDQTNLSAKKRKGLLKQIPNDYFKICVYWDIQNEAKWKKQLERPGKFIPESVLKSMLDNYTHPTYDEGWDMLYKEKVS